jgi:hypothetical protein
MVFCGGVRLILYSLIALLFATTNVAQSAGTDLQLQFSTGQLIDGIVDWANSAIDSFGPLAEGPQQVQFIDSFVDWINSMLDGGSPPSSSTAPKPPSYAFPMT